MRGDFSVELSVKTLTTDAHSGLGGSIFPNAAWRLTWALATLKARDERIQSAGWYDDVLEPSDHDRELLAALPNEEEQLKVGYGLTGFLGGATGVALRQQEVFVPTCTISGLTSGYQGPGSKTVLPAEAREGRLPARAGARLRRPAAKAAPSPRRARLQRCADHAARRRAPGADHLR